MFKLSPKLKRLDVSAQSVLRLQRSLGDVQTAFPGWQSQRATAYVCAFSTEKGARVAVAFFMKESCELVFYLNDEGDVPRSDLGKVFSEGVYFAESLGFMLGDVNLTAKDAAEKEEFWRSHPLSHLPVKTAVQPPEPESAPGAEPPPVPAKESLPPASKPEIKPVKDVVTKAKLPPQKTAATKGQDKPKPPAKESAPVSVSEKQPAKDKTPQTPQPAPKKAESAAVDLDLGLSGRTPLVALRRRKEPPSAEELEEKRQRLLENLGRFFGSM